jgi:soluble lytic murein transglycosylase-like protein
MKKFHRIVNIIILLSGSKFLLAADGPSSAQSAQRLHERALLRNGFSLIHDHREVKETVTRLYMSASGENFVDVPTDQITAIEKLEPEEEALLTPPAPVTAPPALQNKKTLHEIVQEVARRHNIDADFLESVIAAESGGNTRAVSRKGAQGLMQLMPDTASKLGVKNSFDPEANVEAGTRYLLDLLALYHNDVAKALAAYNAGPLRIQQYHGVPPYRETRAYVRRIINDFNRKKDNAVRKPTPTRTAASATAPTGE